MQEMFKMFIVLVVLSSFAGGVLAVVKSETESAIENQQLKYTKAPAIKKIFKEATNNPLQDRFKLKLGDKEKTFFIGEINGKKNNIVFEGFGKGFSGDIGLMVAVNLVNDKIIGVGITTHSETPGIGSKAKTDEKFIMQFVGMPISSLFAVNSDGGKIDALSGATVTSRGVCGALNNAKDIYLKLKKDIKKELWIVFYTKN